MTLRGLRNRRRGTLQVFEASKSRTDLAIQALRTLAVKVGSSNVMSVLSEINVVVSSRTEFYSSVSHAIGGTATSPRSPTPLSRAMGQGQPISNFHQCSVTRARESQRNHHEPTFFDNPVVCHNCDKLIVGVFVRIKDKNLHVECFKCSTCGTSLKNVGYYNINNKLYCDIHAKLVARQNAPAGLVPLTVSSGGKAPAGTISAALANVGAGAPLAPLSPSLSNHSSPQPFSVSLKLSIEPNDEDYTTKSLSINDFWFV